MATAPAASPPGHAGRWPALSRLARGTPRAWSLPAAHGSAAAAGAGARRLAWRAALSGSKWASRSCSRSFTQCQPNKAHMAGSSGHEGKISVSQAQSHEVGCATRVAYHVRLEQAGVLRGVDLGLRLSDQHVNLRRCGWPGQAARERLGSCSAQARPTLRFGCAIRILKGSCCRPSLTSRGCRGTSMPGSWPPADVGEGMLQAQVGARGATRAV
jgi:hypothetical protein